MLLVLLGMKRAIENLVVQNCTVKNMFVETTYISGRGVKKKNKVSTPQIGGN